MTGDESGPIWRGVGAFTIDGVPVVVEQHQEHGGYRVLDLSEKKPVTPDETAHGPDRYLGN